MLLQIIPSTRFRDDAGHEAERSIRSTDRDGIGMVRGTYGVYGTGFLTTDMTGLDAIQFKDGRTLFTSGLDAIQFKDGRTLFISSSVELTMVEADGSIDSSFNDGEFDSVGQIVVGELLEICFDGSRSYTSESPVQRISLGIRNGVEKRFEGRDSDQLHPHYVYKNAINYIKARD